jgi:general stress protein 26
MEASAAQAKVQLEKIRQMVTSIGIAMMTTHDQQENMVSRPMALQEVDKEGIFWFFTSSQTPKTAQVNRDLRINLAFSEPGKETYVSVSGAARHLRDEQKIAQLWNEEASTWFPQGKEDSNLLLMRVEPHLVSCWDASSHQMVELFQLTHSLLASESQQEIENQQVSIDQIRNQMDAEGFQSRNNTFI